MRIQKNHGPVFSLFAETLQGFPEHRIFGAKQVLRESDRKIPVDRDLLTNNVGVRNGRHGEKRGWFSAGIEPRLGEACEVQSGFGLSGERERSGPRNFVAGLGAAV
jgi:hypothetical protein